MRAFLASSIGVACAAALVLPLSLPAAAAADDLSLSGSTQSLPLRPLSADRSTVRTAQGLPERDVRPFSLVGVVWDDPDDELHGTVQVRTRATAGGWSGWQAVETHNHDHAPDPGTPERESGTVRGSTAPLWVGASDGIEVRVRAEAPRAGAAVEPLPQGMRVELVDPGDDPAPEDDTAAHGPQLPAATAPDTEPGGEAGTGTEAGAGAGGGGETDPEVETDPDAGTGTDDGTDTDNGTGTDTGTDDGTDTDTGTGTDPGSGTDPDADPDQGTDTGQTTSAGLTLEETAASAVNADLAELGALEISELTKAETEAGLVGFAKPYIGPRPRIVTRKGWGADEKLRERNFVYTKSVQAAFVHHSATGNNYTCKQAPSVLRSIYRYHVQSSGWRDFGYNFAIDKCGNIYEGRAGGVAKAVLGAHTLGFNTNTMGIAVLGTYSSSTPPAAAVTGIAKLTAWKLGLYGKNPKGKSTLVSGGGNRYKKGTKVKLNTISGHRDGFATECPGAKLYGKLGTARSASAKYQGRT
ncbi:N-acetylmuramoyl-L-alanine amidase [Streptomyces sp. NPDC050856]|uniref:peptidoglycan recognition protein family protein n=1 Tax=Streptomyces sp. NPDC050856 TaxID=3154939 RepID=UPI003411D4D1